MSQVAIDFGPTESSRSSWLETLEAIKEIVSSVGLKQLAYDLDVSPSLLGDALAERDRKGVRAEWLPTLLARASDMQAEALLTALAGPRGFDVERREVLTAEEELRRLKRAIRDQLGSVGEEVLRRAAR